MSEHDHSETECREENDPPSSHSDYVSQGASPDYKYLMLKVPDYEGTRDGNTSKVSYLRMGANPRASDNVTEEGGALVDKAKNEIINGKQTWFIDDDRDRTGDGDATGKAARQAVSAQLTEKCGWRDHSDGNRISTTGGDKIEVIRGNYKLMVLGRQDDKDNAAMIDGSGGLWQDNDIAPGAISSIKWVQDQGGTWKVQEETEKGDVKTIFHGKQEEYFYGPLKKSVIGSADQGTLALESNESSTATKANPELVEETYAKQIQKFTRVGTGHSDADYFTSPLATSDGDVTEVVDVQGTMETRIMATTVKERMGQAYHPVHLENRVFGTSDERWHGNFYEMFLGAMESLRLAGFSMELNAAAVAMEVFIAKSFQVFVGACTELTLARKVEIKTGGGDEFTIGGTTKFADFMKKNAVQIFLG